MFIYINEQSQMDALYEDMVQTDLFALDTEFIKVDTFRPILGLLQINANGHVYVLDGKTLDFTDFWNMVFNARLNVFHACGEDIDLIHYYADKKPLTNIFDTQIGLSFLGHGLQLSYQQALQTQLGVSIDKGETRSNWLARPLRPAQLQYAANDVIHLPALASQIENLLKQKQLWQFALQDCSDNALDSAQETDAQQMYLEVAHYRHTRLQLQQLQQLCAWREHLARATNQPRGFILKNATLLDIVEIQPKTCQKLQEAKDLHPLVFKEYARTIFDLLYHLPPKEDWPKRLPRPYKSRDDSIMPLVKNVVLQVSQDIDLPSDVLLRKKWLNELFYATVLNWDESKLSPHLRGWRYSLLSKPILNILHQHRDLIAVEMAPLKSGVF